MTDTGQMVLVVPGVIPEGTLELGVYPNAVTLAAEGEVFVRVEDIEAITLGAMCLDDMIPLIAVPDDDNPPGGITHEAHVKDYRNV